MIKFYQSGQDFLADNKDVLVQYLLETVFFELNGKSIEKTNSNDFLLKVVSGSDYLIAVHINDYPMNIFGNEKLCAEFARIAFDNKLTFGKILGNKDVCEAFLQAYANLTGVTYCVNHSMDIMSCRNVLTTDERDVEVPTKDDVDELSALLVSFSGEAMGEQAEFEKMKAKVINGLQSFAIIRKDGKIASLASKMRETEFLTAIGNVYTLPQYRNQGLSCKIVTKLTKEITDCGKLAYLFVDKTNPVSNHLYTKIGYTYAVPQYEYKINF